MNYRNLAVSLLLSTGLFAQAVVGVVLDADSEPLVGANVVVEGTDLGGGPDSEGNFTIDIVSGDYTLTAAYIGYVPNRKSVSVGGIVFGVS